MQLTLHQKRVEQTTSGVQPFISFLPCPLRSRDSSSSAFDLTSWCPIISVYHNITDCSHLTSLYLEVADTESVLWIDLQEVAGLAVLVFCHAARLQQLFWTDGTLDLAM